MNSVQKLTRQEGHIHTQQNTLAQAPHTTAKRKKKKEDRKEFCRLNSQRLTASEPSQYETYTEGNNL